VGGEIERRASQVFLISDDVPQDFSDADNFQGTASRISSALILCSGRKAQDGTKLTSRKGIGNTEIFRHKGAESAPSACKSTE